MYGGTAADEDTYLWRVGHWLVPTFAVVPYPAWPRGDKIWTPIDDHIPIAVLGLLPPRPPVTARRSVTSAPGW